MVEKGLRSPFLTLNAQTVLSMAQFAPGTGQQAWKVMGQTEKCHSVHLPWISSSGKSPPELAAWPEGWAYVKVIDCVGGNWSIPAMGGHASEDRLGKVTLVPSPFSLGALWPAE